MSQCQLTTEKLSKYYRATEAIEEQDEQLFFIFFLYKLMLWFTMLICAAFDKYPLLFYTYEYCLYYFNWTF